MTAQDDSAITARMSNGRGLVVLATVVLLWGVGVGHAQTEKHHQGPLRFLVSNGVKAAMVAVTPRCEATVGASVLAVYGTSSALRAVASSDGSFDAAVMTTDALDELTTSGALQATSRRPVARTRVGVGVRDGARVPDVRTADAVRAALLASASVTYATEGASRPFVIRMFERLGVVEQMAAKTHPEASSVGATARVVGGRTEMVLTLVSEIVPVVGLRLAGPLPDEFQGHVTFAAGAGAQSTRGDETRRMLACLTAPETEAAYAAVGLERRQP